jgi:hypothetical protein
LLAPLWFLPLLAPEITLVALPSLLANLLSSRQIMHSLPGGYYASFVTPFLMLAALHGFARLQARLGVYGTAVVSVNLGLWALACITQGALWHFAKPLVMPAPPTLATRQNAQRSAEAKRFLAMIPPRATVSAQIAFVSQLSHRSAVYTFPNPFYQRAWGNTVQARREMEAGFLADKVPRDLAQAVRRAPAEYVLLCPRQAMFPLQRPAYVATAKALVNSESYAIAAIGKSCLLLRRRSANQAQNQTQNQAATRAVWQQLQAHSGLPVTSTAQVAPAFAKWLEKQLPRPKPPFIGPPFLKDVVRSRRQS